MVTKSKMIYGVYGGKSFGGTAPMVNKYFNKKSEAVKFKTDYKKKFPQRKLKLAQYKR